jgi:hypothetical protein
VRTRPEGIRVAQDVLERFQELWRGRIERMTDLITVDHQAKETDR